MPDVPPPPEDPSDAGPAARRALPDLPTLPSPAVTARLLAELPPGPARDAVRHALDAFAAALAGRWAEERLGRRRRALRDTLESDVMHLFRMLDSGWRFADEPEEARALRRRLMADGVGHQLDQPWPETLRWMRALADALNHSVPQSARGRHMTWILERFTEDVVLGAQASPPLPAAGDGVVLAAARALEAALLDALEAFAEAGGDLDRLVAAVESDGRTAAYEEERPVEPDAGPAVRQEPSSSVEIEEAPDE